MYEPYMWLLHRSVYSQINHPEKRKEKKKNLHSVVCYFLSREIDNDRHDDDTSIYILFYFLKDLSCINVR